MKKIILLTFILSCFSCATEKGINQIPIAEQIQEQNQENELEQEQEFIIPEPPIEVNELGWIFEGIDTEGDKYYWDEKTSRYGFFDSINKVWDYYISQDLDKYLPNRRKM
jgi:hypothetical protein